MDLSAFYAQFREETTDNVRNLADGLLTLERAPNDRATLDSVFRAAHTVKGSARLLGFSAVGSLAHAMESLLAAMRAGTIQLSPALNDLLLQANDVLLNLAIAASEQRTATDDPAPLIGRLERAAQGGSDEPSSAPSPESASPPATREPTNAEAPPPPPARPALSSTPPTPTPAPAPQHHVDPPPSSGTIPSAKAPRATVRVRVDRLDRLLAVAGELTVGQQADGLHLQSLQTMAAMVSQQQRLMQALQSEMRHARLAPAQRQTLLHRLDELHLQGAELGQLLRAQAETYTRRSAASTLLVDELEAEIFAARLVPVATIFATLPRAVRELARSLGKEVDLELHGEETEADRKVLDALSDPLLHMVRNALDHGLETPAERERADKLGAGKLTIAAMAEHGQIRIAVSDDGRGMDPVKIKAAAVRKGLLDEQAANLLNDTEALDLIFTPGFSMSPIITDVSGRGVGMDVVRSRMIELGGQVLIDSLVGYGTTITLVLPVSLMTSQVLLVEAGKQLWALPSRSCHGLLRLDREAIHQIEGQALLHVDGKAVPLARLSDLLDLPHESTGFTARGHALLVGAARPVAVLIDRLVDEREVVVKPLGPLFPAHPVAAGVAPLPDGALAVVLSTQGLLDRVRRVRNITMTPKRNRPRHWLLIADDSFTTRELLRSILQSAGYDVTTAVDGQDALDKLRADNRYDLVVSDVEMPRMDGFGLTSNIRSDPVLTHLPVIIVTSLHSDEHKRRGVQAGAQAYIVKSQFDQANLLSAVRDLLGAAS